MAHRLHIVDVFAEQPYTGNQLAVVIAGEAVSDQTMQLVAAEMNYSETTFVTPVPEDDGGYRVRIFTPARTPLAAAGLPPLVYLFCRETHHPQNDLCARFFFEAHGVREDPATGNGAAFLGAYLLEHRFLFEPGFSVRIEQGYEIRRPSLVRLRARRVDGLPEVSVGGSVVPTVRGELL